MITIRCTRSRGPRGFFCLQVFRRGPVNVAVILPVDLARIRSRRRTLKSFSILDLFVATVMAAVLTWANTYTFVSPAREKPFRWPHSSRGWPFTHWYHEIQTGNSIHLESNLLNLLNVAIGIAITLVVLVASRWITGRSGRT